MSEITLDIQPQNIEDGYLIWHLTRIEVSATLSPASYESRKVTATFEQNSPIRVAVPLVPGFPQPENTIVLQNVQDQAQMMLQDIKTAIDVAIKNETKEKGW